MIDSEKKKKKKKNETKQNKNLDRYHVFASPQNVMMKTLRQQLPWKRTCINMTSFILLENEDESTRAPVFALENTNDFIHT